MRVPQLRVQDVTRPAGEGPAVRLLQLGGRGADPAEGLALVQPRRAHVLQRPVPGCHFGVDITRSGEAQGECDGDKAIHR